MLGNNVDTDQIYPGRYLALVDPEEIKSHCLEGCESLHQHFKKGDIVAAGSNFGCGSSREHAVIAIMHMGASMVIADSFARIFYRNALNLGLPVQVVGCIAAAWHQGRQTDQDQNPDPEAGMPALLCFFHLNHPFHKAQGPLPGVSGAENPFGPIPGIHTAAGGNGLKARRALPVPVKPGAERGPPGGHSGQADGKIQRVRHWQLCLHGERIP